MGRGLPAAAERPRLRVPSEDLPAQPGPADRRPRGLVARDGGPRLANLFFYLWRRNLLRHALSNVAASQSGRYVYRGLPPPRTVSLPLDVAALLGAMGMREQVAARERAALAAVPHQSLCYEDDLCDPARQQRTLSRLCARLGLPDAPARSDVRQALPDRLEDIVADYPGLVAGLRGTRWEGFLAE